MPGHETEVIFTTDKASYRYELLGDKTITSIQDPQGNATNSIQFSNNGLIRLEYLKSGLWHIRRHQDNTLLHSVSGAAKVAAVSADGELVALARDRSIQIYRISTATRAIPSK